MNLLNKKCVPCDGGTPPLSEEAAKNYLKETPAWTLSPDANNISREFNFKDFLMAMDFVNKVATLAESEGHHPDIYIFYNKVKLELWTHAVGGLSENDFILAAKINTL